MASASAVNSLIDLDSKFLWTTFISSCKTSVGLERRKTLSPFVKIHDMNEVEGEADRTGLSRRKEGESQQ